MTAPGPDRAGLGQGGALARCVADPAAFLAAGWGQRPVHTPRADRRAFADLLSLDDVDRLVTSGGLRTPAFRMVKGGSPVPPSRYLRSARIGSRTVTDLVDAGGVFAGFHDGATIVLQGVQRFWPPVSAFCRDLELALGQPVQANAYVTPPTSSGLRVHVDGHDVFALQTFGRKHWAVYEHGEDSGEATLDVVLEPGDALYLPRGTRHAARTVDAPSAHLTVGVHATTWGEVLERAAGRIARLPQFSGRVPAGLARDGSELAGAAAEVLSAFAKAVEALDPAEVAVEERRRFLAGRLPPLRGMLTDLLAVDQLSDTSAVRRRPGTVCAVELAGEGLRVTLGDRALHMPAAVEPAMRRVAGVAPGGTLRPADLAGHLDAPGRLVLVRRLVREGLLTLDPPSGGAAG